MRLASDSAGSRRCVPGAGGGRGSGRAMCIRTARPASGSHGRRGFALGAGGVPGLGVAVRTPSARAGFGGAVRCGSGVGVRVRTVLRGSRRVTRTRLAVVGRVRWGRAVTPGAGGTVCTRPARRESSGAACRALASGSVRGGCVRRWCRPRSAVPCVGGGVLRGPARASYPVRFRWPFRLLGLRFRASVSRAPFLPLPVPPPSPLFCPSPSEAEVKRRHVARSA